MNRPPPTHTEFVSRFLRIQRIRNRETRRIYGHILLSFLRFVFDDSMRAPLSISNLQKWLHAKRLKWPIHMLCLRARLVERFLDWSQAHGVISTNPFTELHQIYGPRTAPIVRALASDDVEDALRKLLPTPRYGSFLGKVMEEHVGLKRSLGYRYNVNEGSLLRFDRFLQSRPELVGKPLNQLIEAWSQSHPNPNHLRETEKVGRLLSKAVHRLDTSVEILPMNVEGRHQGHQQQRKPYVFSDEEIMRLLKAALSFPSPKAPLRPICLYTMAIFAYCAGLRLGEIVALTMGDTNLEDGTIEIRETKFFKHRRLPLADSVIAAVKDYLVARQQAGAPANSASALFWNRRLGQGYSKGGVSILLVELMRRAGLKPPSGPVGPRIHDLRHTMVGHRMRDWYREGINAQSKLPYLATYLGHKDIASTLVYLNITPELLHEASERFRNNSTARLQDVGDSL